MARREQSIGSLRIHKPLGFGITVPRELEVSWIVISLGSAASQDQYAGVRLHIDSVGDDMPAQECYLDIDEVQEFLDGMDVVSSFREVISESVTELRDVYYSSKEDARVGIFKSEDSSELRPYLTLLASGDLHLFTSSADEPPPESSALVPVEGDEFGPLRTLIDSARMQLRHVIAT